jgi:hypothetical protein
MLLRIQGYNMTIKYKPGKEIILADPLSRHNPFPRLCPPSLPSEETVDLQRVCLVQFSDAKLDTLMQDTSSDLELSALREIIYSGWPAKQKQ